MTEIDVTVIGGVIRARLCPPAQPFEDFLIRRDLLNPRLIQCAGMDSPGLTSSLAAGGMVAGLATESSA